MNHNLPQTNQAYLQTHFPPIARAIEQGEYPRSLFPFTLEDTSSGTPTAFLKRNNRPIYLHSQYDPVREAQRWAASHPPQENAVIMFVGWGLGYHVCEWLRLYKQKAEAVIVWEPEPAFFEASLSCIDLRTLSRARRVHLVLGQDSSAMETVLHGLIEPLLSRDVQMIPLPFAGHYPQEATDFLKEVFGRFALYKENILRHMAQTGTLCQEHIIRNIPAMADSLFPGHVRNIAQGHPALIIAAGPSLDQNILDIPRLQSNALLFAVDTVFPVLHQYGIQSHFVVTKDPSERNQAHFGKGGDDESSILIFDPQVAPQIPARFKGCKLCMPNRNYALHHHMEELHLCADDILPHSTNVAIAAFHIAIRMGCDPVIFVGLDFCFSQEGGASHASDTALRSVTRYDPQSRRMVYQRGEACEEIQALEVEGIDGALHPTTPNFLESLRLLESFIASTPVRCIDASEGGAKIKGTHIMPLQQAGQSFCNTPLDFSFLRRLTIPNRNYKKLKQSLYDITNHLEQCRQCSSHVLREMDSFKNHGMTESQCIDILQKARLELEHEYRLYHELQSALERMLVNVGHPAFWEFTSPLENNLEKYQAYFTCIQQACETFGPLYQEVADSISD